jgi:hypothetical protein
VRFVALTLAHRAWWRIPGRYREDGGVKRSTAIGHLVEMADVATERLRLRNTDIQWPLEELWVTGELLGPGDAVDAGSVVVALDEPADELPWLALRDEVVVPRRHLRIVLDRYWDRDWRRTHGSYDESPEDHLWRAATAVEDIHRALDELCAI